MSLNRRALIGSTAIEFKSFPAATNMNSSWTIDDVKAVILAAR